MLKKRTDSNHKEIVDCFRKCGATVQTLHTIGKGCPDLLVGYRGKNLLVEVKTSEGDLNNRQNRFADEWMGEKPYVVRTKEDIEKLLNSL